MKEAICFLPTLPSMGEWSHSCCDVGNCQYLLGFHYFIWPTARVIVALLRWIGFIVVVKDIYSSVARDIGDMLWTYNLCFFFSFLAVVFLAQWFVNFFLTFFKASTSYGYFHYVSYGIFAHWFSLDQMFKFSVSFATEVEKNRPSHGCFNRGLRSTKDSKRATNNVHDLKSLLLSLNNPCSFKCLKSVAVMVCVWLQPFLFFIFFYFSVVCYK